MNNIGVFFETLSRSLKEAYATYDEVDPSAKLLIASIKFGANGMAIENFQLNPQWLKFKSFLTSNDSLLRHLELITDTDGNEELHCRLYFDTQSHDVFVDVIINPINQQIVCVPYYCIHTIGDHVGNDDDFDRIPNSSVEELISQAKRISLLGRIQNS